MINLEPMGSAAGEGDDNKKAGGQYESGQLMQTKLTSELLGIVEEDPKDNDVTPKRNHLKQS